MLWRGLRFLKIMCENLKQYKWTLIEKILFLIYLFFNFVFNLVFNSKSQEVHLIEIDNCRL